MNNFARKALTFDDILLAPGYSEVTPNMVDVSTYVARDIKLNIPLISAAMDSVTESDMAISMARNGGMGIVHKNNTIAEQRREVEKVKKVRKRHDYLPYYRKAQ